MVALEWMNEAKYSTLAGEIRMVLGDDESGYDGKTKDSTNLLQNLIFYYTRVCPKEKQRMSSSIS